MDPLGDFVISVRGHGADDAQDYELPPAVTLDVASAVLDLDPEDGLLKAQTDLYPVPVINLHEEGFRVGTAHLIRRVGLDRVRADLRFQG